MARPSNDGLDYFPLDVDYFSDIKIMRVSEQFGDAGELAALKLTAWIYKSGYAVEWDEVSERIFARRVMFNPQLPIHEIVECLLDVGYFDRDLYQRRGVLTSRGIQKRWVAAQKASHRPYDIDPDLCLIDDAPKAKAPEKPEESVKVSEDNETPSEGFANTSRDFAKSPESVANTSENFALKKRKEKKSITNQPTNARVREGGPEGTEDHPPDPVRAEVVRILIPPGDYSVDKALIDRIVEGIHAGIPGFTTRDLKRISKRADDECARYERSDGRSGKKHRWMTIADEAEARYKSAGRPWENEYAGENEPPPRPRSSPIVAPPPPEPPEEDNPDALLAQLLDRDTDPGGETLDQTQKRLRCSPGEAYTERANWRRLKQLVPQP